MDYHRLALPTWLLAHKLLMAICCSQYKSLQQKLKIKRTRNYATLNYIKKEIVFYKEIIQYIIIIYYIHLYAVRWTGF